MIAKHYVIRAFNTCRAQFQDYVDSVVGGSTAVEDRERSEVTPTTPTLWQSRKGTLLLAMFREKYRLLAHYSTTLFPELGVFSADLTQGGLEVHDFSLEKCLYNAISLWFVFYVHVQRM